MRHLYLLFMFTTLFAAAQAPAPAIIPAPQRMEMKPGALSLYADTPIEFEARNTILAQAAEALRGWRDGLNLGKSPRGVKPAPLRLQLDTSLSAEDYRLSLSAEGGNLKASEGAGFFYALQSLMQLGQPWAARNTPELSLPAVEIEDAPAFPYRGMHLDVGRHFFPVAFIKQYIDMLARYKMNRFHWHLTEDQGWRIEIKQYPKLQEIAAFRDETLIGHYSDQPHQLDGQRYGGFYTQEEVKEVVAYAQSRFVMVIPEIELPGHAQAAIAAYPELGCTGKQIAVATKWGIFEDVYCPSEATFEFLENVLTEVMALFPSPYIHIGGDECPKAQWEASELCQRIIQEEGLKDEHELQSFFIRRIEGFLNENGRKLIGWDEILEGGLAPNATVMSWRGEAGGIAAAKQGHDVVMTPTTYCYFDYYQSNHPDEPLAIGGLLPLEKVYHYHPVPEELSAEEAKHILGAQGNVWTEYMKTPEKVEYMAYPRMQALSEVVWSGKGKKDFPGFVSRLEHHLAWMRQENINAAERIYDLEAKMEGGQGEPLSLRFSSLIDRGEIRLSRLGKTEVYQGPFLPASGEYRAQIYLDDQPMGREVSVELRRHKAAGKPLTLEHPAHPKYNGDRPEVILNGIVGSPQRYGDEEWLGFEGQDFVATIDLGQAELVRSINLRFFHSPGQWVYAPKEANFSGWDSGKGEWVSIGRQEVPRPSGKITRAWLRLDKPAQFSKLRIEVPNYGLIPEGEQGAGHKAWLFIDEITVD